MPRVLLGDPRLRILDSNANPPGNVNPFRLDFFESDATTPKAVYYTEVGGVGAQIVFLDAEGYVPVTGIWLDVGIYTMVVKKKISNTGIDSVDWIPLWTFPNLNGALPPDPSTATHNVQFLSSINELRSITGDGFAYLTGYYNVADGGEGPFTWVADSTQVDDGGMYIKPIALSSSLPGRWHRLSTEGEYDVRKWGAITGQADVSAEIILAMQYCAATSDESGKTLLFPNGEYNLGTAHLVLDGMGHNLTSRDRPVAYHLQSNAIFRATNNSGPTGSTPSASIEFVGPTQVDGKTTHASAYVQIIFSSVVNNGTGVYPEWWGATGTDVSYADLPLYFCWNGCGDNDINLEGAYYLAGSEGGLHTRTDGTKPTLKFSGDSYIYQPANTNPIEIGNILCGIRSSANRALRGALDGFNIYGYHMEASWFDIPTVQQFKLLMKAFNYGEKELFWVDNFIWDANYNCVTGTDAGTNVTHTFATTNKWFINNAQVQVTSIVPPERQFITFALATNTGTFNIGNIWDFKAVWFGATGTSVTTQMRHFFRSCIAFQIGMDFSDFRSTITDGITMVLPNNSQLRIRNLRLQLTDPTKTMFTISDAGAGSNTQIHFRNCELDTTSTPFPQPLIACAVDNLLLEDSYLTYGTLSVNNRGASTIRGTTFSTCPSYILLNAFLNMRTTCKHTDSPVVYYGNISTSTFANIYDKGNYFKRTTGTFDIGFVANGSLVKASNVRIDNTNCLVKDLTDGTNGTWFDNAGGTRPYAHGHWHDIVIEGQTNGVSKTGDNWSDQSNRITKHLNAFRLYGVVSSEARINSIEAIVYGINSGEANTQYVIPIQVWAQDYITNDGAGTTPADCQVIMAWQFFTDPASTNVLNLRYSWTILL